jgi:hypothetical protein
MTKNKIVNIRQQNLRLALYEYYTEREKDNSKGDHKDWTSLNLITLIFFYYWWGGTESLGIC